MSKIQLAPIAATAAALLIAACSTSTTTTTPPPTKAPAAKAPAASAPASHTASAAAATTPGLSGKWSGQYSGAYSGTFVLRWHQSGSNLKGIIKISASPSSFIIRGSVVNGTIRFGTVGSMAIIYSCTVSGNSMSGNYQVAGQSGGPWSASKG